MFIKNQKTLTRKIKETADLAKDMVTMYEKIDKQLKKGRNPKKLTTKFHLLTDKIETKGKITEEDKFDAEEFHEIIFQRENLLYDTKLGSSATSSLMTSQVFNYITKIISFGLAFTLSYYVGNMLEQAYAPLGEFWSKLIPAIIFFFTFDNIINRIEDTFLWRRVKYLSGNAEKIEKLALERKFVLNNLKK